MAEPLSDLLKLPPGAVDLSSYDSRATSGFKGDKRKGKQALADLGPTVSDLQERLHAESRVGGKRSVLLVLQGMDTSGKGGVMRHCGGLLDPQGLEITAFKAPTPSERRHDFLWRIERRIPGPGRVGIFDRSHYEDVLIAKVHELATPEEIKRRYAAINDFEKHLVDSETTVIKCFLHISKDKQKERLMARLDDPTKHWKYNPGDIDERMRWDDYKAAYEIALRRCNTKAAPFYVVPSDRKWYRNWAITRLLIEHLQAMHPQWPEGDFDVELEKERLAAS
ncbi:MAG: polyphosphate kinase 2 family protein [Actinomycetota bacterium]|nr:polyphosphate kinase 2 family protein [Actinomycetota bacterium]